MFADWVDQLTFIISMIKANLWFTLSIIGGLWVIQIVNVISRYQLNLLGIRPRKFFGLIGIVCAPFLHGDFKHLFFNSIPLWLLINLILISGKMHFYIVTAVIALSSGFAVWLLGRKGVHIGASGLIMGYWGYLLVQACLYPNVMTVIIGILVIYYLGGLIANLVPIRKYVSWEGHLFGFLAGVLMAWFWGGF